MIEYISAISEIFHNNKIIPWILLFSPMGIFGFQHLWLGRYKQFALYAMTFSVWGLGWFYDLYYLQSYINEKTIAEEIKPIKRKSSPSSLESNHYRLSNGHVDHRPSHHNIETPGEIKRDDENIFLSRPNIGISDKNDSASGEVYLLNKEDEHELALLPLAPIESIIQTAVRDIHTELPLVGRGLTQTIALTSENLQLSPVNESVKIKSAEPEVPSPPSTESPPFEAAVALDVARVQDSAENRIMDEMSATTRTAEEQREIEQQMIEALQRAHDELELQNKSETLNIDHPAVAANQNETTHRLDENSIPPVTITTEATKKQKTFSPITIAESVTIPLTNNLNNGAESIHSANSKSVNEIISTSSTTSPVISPRSNSNQNVNKQPNVTATNNNNNNNGNQAHHTNNGGGKKNKRKSGKK